MGEGTGVGRLRGPSTSKRRPRTSTGRLLVLVAMALAVVVVAYLLLVLTARGQRVDNLAFQGRKATDLGVRRALTAVMRSLTFPVVVAGCLAIFVDAARRQIWKTGLLVVLVGVCVGITRALKAVLSRPHLADLAYTHPENTFPSGHSAAVMGLILVWIWIASRSGRDPHAVACIFGLIAWTTTMLGSGWHRPSDVIGGLAVAAVVVVTFVALSTRIRSRPPRSTATSRSGPPAATVEPADDLRIDRPRPVVAGIAAVMASMLFVVLVRNTPSNPNHSLGSYLLGLLICNSFAVGVVVTLSRETGGSRSRPVVR